jgi:hypothetical protein
MKDLRTVLCFGLAIALAGCSPDGFRRVKVQGVVTLEGQPLAGVFLQFLPQAPKGDEASGMSGPDGSFRLASSRHDVVGAVPGEYAVIVRVPETPVLAPGETVPKPSTAVIPFPAVYGSSEKTPLRVTIPSSGGSIKIELSKTPQASKP